MPRLSIVLPEEEHRALCDLAVREWREPRSQAAVLLLEGLRRAGILPPEQAPADRPSNRTTVAVAQ
jgi:hypothetical protein